MKFSQGGAFDGYAQADEGIVDNVTAVPLPRILSGATDGEMAQVGQVAHGVYEAGHVGGGVKQWRILLSENITELRVGILGTREHRAHARVGRIEEGNLISRNRVNKRREKGGVRVR